MGRQLSCCRKPFHDLYEDTFSFVDLFQFGERGTLKAGGTYCGTVPKICPPKFSFEFSVVLDNFLPVLEDGLFIYRLEVRKYLG